MENQQKESDRRRIHIFYLAIIGVLTALCGILAWQYWEQRQRADKEIVIKEEVIVERDNVRNDLLDLQSQYAELQTNDAALQQELDTKRAMIDSLIKEAEKHKGNAYIISKLKKETETLRKIMKGYIRTIDSLNTLNQDLIVQRDKVAADLSKEKDKTTLLAKEKENLQGVVNIASALKASAMKAMGVRYKAGGKKEDETNKAKRVEKIKVVFSIGVNELAKAGERTLYMRVLTPDGKELAKSDDESSMVKFNGARGFFASKKEIDYNNQELMVKMLTEKRDEWLPGKYLIEIISEELIIGQTSVVLE